MIYTPGTQYCFRRTVTNTSHTVPAEGVQLQLTYPTGFVYVSHYVIEGPDVFDGTTWDIGTLAPNSSVQIRVCIESTADCGEDRTIYTEITTTTSPEFVPNNITSEDIPEGISCCDIRGCFFVSDQNGDPLVGSGSPSDPYVVLTPDAVLNDLADVNVGTPGPGEDQYPLVWDDTSGTFILAPFSVAVGPQGDTGPQGTQGAQGDAGPQGVQGDQGVQGPQGGCGAQGTQGVDGPQGPQGNAGPQGAQGPQGLIGIQGVQGVQGAQGVTGTGGALGHYGIFFSDTDQSALLPFTGYPVSLSDTVASNGVSVASSSQITFTEDGTYSIDVSLQLHNLCVPCATGTVWVWLSLNGTDISDSARRHTLDDMEEYSVAAFNYLYDFVAGDYVELIWSTDNVNCVIEQIPAAAPVPAIPSAMVNVAQVMYTQVGPQGPQGDAGAQGPQGDAGPQGTQGVQGADGVQGAQGTQGVQGAVGVQGVQGAQGVQGSCTCNVISVFGKTGVITADPGDYTAVKITNTPSGSISSTNVQGALNELDSDLTTVTNKQNSLVTLSGVSALSNNLGTFTGSTIADNVTVKQALQSLETAVEAAVGGTVVTEIDANVDDLITLSGVAENSTSLGTFTGTTIPDNRTVKQAFQVLETSLEEVDQNVNDVISLTGIPENVPNLGVFTGGIISNNTTVKNALQELETEVAAASSTYAIVTTTTELSPLSMKTNREFFLLADTDTVGSVVVTLPPATTTGMVITVKRLGASSLTVITATGEYIDDSVSDIVGTSLNNGEALRLISIGTTNGLRSEGTWVKI